MLRGRRIGPYQAHAPSCYYYKTPEKYRTSYGNTLVLGFEAIGLRVQTHACARLGRYWRSAGLCSEL